MKGYANDKNKKLLFTGRNLTKAVFYVKKLSLNIILCWADWT